MGYGKNNRRRGKVSVSKKKKSTNPYKYKTKFIGNPTLATGWDHTLTTRQNYEKLGYNCDPNADVCTQKKRKPQPDDVVELYDVPDSDFLHTKNYYKKPNHMSEEEIKYLTPLIEAHGEEYENMIKDLKRNHLQWTAAKLKRRIARLKLFESNLL